MSAFDLDGYLTHLGVVAREPTVDALGELQAAHARCHGFDNVDVLLEQHPGVELDAVVEKFVGRGRGGYCFEHATLFHAALLGLGYDVTLRLARVGDPWLAARTHLDMVVVLDGDPWLVDPGIGVPPLGPIRLEDGARLEGGVWTHEVRRDQAGWQLWRERSAGWELMHTTDDEPVRPVDVRMGHHWTSTHPSSHFRSTLTVAQHGVAADGTAVHTTVSLEGVTERRAGGAAVRRPLDLDELPGLLTGLGAGLDESETTRLVRRVGDLLRDRGV
ncbi:arylamine N-acetyltransferase [Nocardioides aestuarii]|uniref:Arylamine N-acetyltransferase n=1 Tax=Nocardioides aestuarii TaxID=252231 RepID=A0ABW4TJV8_9ACTN